MALSEESFLPDAEDCAETWRQLRWPDGPEQKECGRWFTDRTVHRLSMVIREAICERREEWLEPLTGEVEASERALEGGPQGRELASGGA